MWTGSDDGWVHVTRDGGKNWERVTPPDLPEFARISLIEASPHQNGVAYLAANRYQMGDRAPYFYKTADFGKTWQKIVSGIPGTDFARVIREDIKRRGLLYAGTEHGIYVSFNDGATWQSLKLDLPTTPVHGIIPEERDLVIGTHGRGFYVLDNISVLRQATPELTSNPLFLFEPFNPMRGRDRNVTFDYYLNTEAPEVKIEFLDAGGTVLRTFTGTPKTAAPAVDDRRLLWQRAAARQHREGHQPLYVGHALRRRDRLPGHDHVGGAAAARSGRASGPLLRAHHRQRQDHLARLQRHRRSAARRRRHQRGRPAGAVQAVGPGARQGERSQPGGDRHPQPARPDQPAAARRSSGRRKDEIQKLADAVLVPLKAVEEEAYQVRNRSGQDPLNYPIKLNNKIAALAGVIESADNKPTDQSVEVFNELSAQLDAQLAKMKETLSKQLPLLNAALKREKLDAVDPKAKPAPPAAGPDSRRTQ